MLGNPVWFIETLWGELKHKLAGNNCNSWM